LPPEMPSIIPIRIHNASIEEDLLTSLYIYLNGYPGRVRLWIPHIEIDGNLEQLIDGMFFSKDSEGIDLWAKRHIAMIRRNQRSKNPYNELWSKQRIEDIYNAIDMNIILEAEHKKSIALNRIV